MEVEPVKDPKAEVVLPGADITTTHRVAMQDAGGEPDNKLPTMRQILEEEYQLRMNSEVSDEEHQVR